MKQYKTVNAFGYAGNSNLLQPLAAAGFIFFLAKGLLWIIAADWIAY